MRSLQDDAMNANKSPMPDANWRRQYPFEPHRLELAHGAMHFVDEPAEDPDAPTLLFVHGNPTWSFHWRRLIVGLRGRYRCVAPDHLGCGLSDKPSRSFRLADRVDHLLTLIDTLGLRRVTLVAQDWGGAIGLGAMLERQELLEGVFLFNTGAFPPWYVPKRIAICKTPLLGRLALQGANAFSRAALSMTVVRSPRVAPDVAAGYLAPYDNWRRRRAVYDFVEDIPRSPRHPTWATLERIEQRLGELATLPIRLVWGMQDWCFTLECLDRFLQHWPDAQATRLPDAGHWVVEDAPEESLESLRAFAAEVADKPDHATAIGG